MYWHHLFCNCHGQQTSAIVFMSWKVILFITVCHVPYSQMDAKPVCAFKPFLIRHCHDVAWHNKSKYTVKIFSYKKELTYCLTGCLGFCCKLSCLVQLSCSATLKACSKSENIHAKCKFWEINLFLYSRETVKKVRDINLFHHHATKLKLNNNLILVQGLIIIISKLRKHTWFIDNSKSRSLAISCHLP